MTTSQKWFVVEKVSIGLASHWPCVTDSMVYPHMGYIISSLKSGILPLSFSIHPALSKYHPQFCTLSIFQCRS